MWKQNLHRDQSRYAPSQWETLLNCNNISHWLGTYLNWPQLTNTAAYCFCHIGIVNETPQGYWPIGFHIKNKALFQYEDHLSRSNDSHHKDEINGLVQESRNSIANTLELRLSYTNPSRCSWKFVYSWGVNLFLIGLIVMENLKKKLKTKWR